jgi:hypothetical protein
MKSLFLSQRAARLFRELLAVKLRLQWVVMTAVSPRRSIDRIPWSTPVLDGQSLIFSISRNSSTLFR